MSLGSPSDPGRHHSPPSLPIPFLAIQKPAQLLHIWYTPTKHSVTSKTRLFWTAFFHLYFLFAYVTWQPSWPWRAWLPPSLPIPFLAIQKPAQLLHIWYTPTKHSVTSKTRLFWTAFFHLYFLFAYVTWQPADPGGHDYLPPPPHPLEGYTGTTASYTSRKHPVTFFRLRYFGLPSFIYIFSLLTSLGSPADPERHHSPPSPHPLYLAGARVSLFSLKLRLWILNGQHTVTRGLFKGSR